MFVLTNLDLYLAVTAWGFVILIYEIFTDYPLLCNLSGSCDDSLPQKISTLLLTIISVAIVIGYCRAVILKTTPDYFSFRFLKRGFFYLLYMFLLVLMIAVPTILGIYGFGMLGATFNIPSDLLNFVFLIPIILTIYFSRIFLVFPATAVDDSKLNLRKSFIMTKGNANRLFWSQLLLMLPCAAALFILAIVYKLLGFDNAIARFIFSALVLALSFLDSCIKASYFAHIYQFFVFYHKPAIQQEIQD